MVDKEKQLAGLKESKSKVMRSNYIDIKTGESAMTKLTAKLPPRVPSSTIEERKASPEEDVENWQPAPSLLDDIVINPNNP